MRDECHPQNLLSQLSRLARIFGDFYTATFASAPGMNLRLHNYAPADVLGCRLGFGDRKRHLAPRHGNFVFGQDRLGLILVNFHLELFVTMLGICADSLPKSAPDQNPTVS